MRITAIEIETRLDKDVLDIVCNRLFSDYKWFVYSIKPNPNGGLLVSVSSNPKCAFKHGFDAYELAYIESMITGKHE